MYQALKNSGRLNITLLLAGMSILCLLLSLFRFYVTGEKLYLFLNWNLFLAFLPWAAGMALVLKQKIHWLGGLSLAVTWLLFFPNAPYILTDLFHLRARGNTHVWYDLVVILSFAWTGLVYGFVSLADMENLAAKKLKAPGRFILVTGMLFLAAFGVYLGRYMRFNSWDVVGDPSTLFYEIGHRFAYPMEHLRTWGMTFFLGLLLNLMYRTFRLFTSQALTGGIRP